MNLRVEAASLVITLLCCAADSASAQIVREEHFVQSEPGIRLFVREVRDESADAKQPPILLLHGARVPGVASFDLPVDGGSLAADLARSGHAVYIMNARGYGRSTRPPEMSAPREENPPLVRSAEVVRDVAAVVEWVQGRGAERVALLGWATGAHWFGYYASLYPERVSHLILYNTLYGATKGHPVIGPGSDLEDPDAPGRFNAAEYGAYRLNTADSLFGSWDRSIPLEDKSAWRDPEVAEAYAAAALASDETSGERKPPTFRAPTGALEDSFYLASGRQLWDASLVRSPTLIITSERDFWSRPGDRQALEEHLVHAPHVRVVILPDATHFVHLDRPERGRDRFIREVLAFIGDSKVAAHEKQIVFETWSNQKVEAFEGSFTVPENREDESSRTIPIEYVRLPATGYEVGPPTVYLAGGPGGSGIEAINYRYQMFMAMREYGDVIALDQRGTGASNVVPECQSRQVVPTTTETSDREFIRYHREALKECLTFWRQNGVDLAGYDTVQNAHDLDALRRHLGAEKIVLWGTSYGSHLALAALKEIEDSIARVVVSSVEGLNQTIKLPARTDEYLGRLQEAIDSQPDAKAAYPDIKELMRRVHAKLEREPVLLTLNVEDGEEVEYLLQRRDMQLIAAGLIADPESAAGLLGIYRALDRGVEPQFDRIPARLLPDSLVDPGSPVSMEGMSVATDLASGMTAERRSEILEQAKTAILGAYLNFTFHFDGMAPELDLGDAFRAKPSSEVPVLVLSGTLDGRTYIESQREAVSELENVTKIIIRNAGHNLFDEPSNEMMEIIDQFMTGRPVHDATIAIGLPEMAPK